MTALLAISLFFAAPQPLEMPRASAYLVREGGKSWPEDRYNVADLWASRAIDGCWVDEAGRVFELSTLAVEPPPDGSCDSEMTRVDFAKTARPIRKRDEAARRNAIRELSPVEIADEPEAPRQLPRGYKDVDYWQGTNRTAIVCAFLFEKCETWRLATWRLAEGDDFDECRAAFENEFLEREAKTRKIVGTDYEAIKTATEREALRMDAKHSIVNYAEWHFTAAPEFAILDDLSSDNRFVETMTNCLTIARAKYVAVMPTEMNVSNVLCVARIFATRDEYIAAAGADMAWSAAYWSPTRRELVAYLPEAGEAELLKTIRHEAFHQYLSYAAAMIPVSPWLNEGYAQYFGEGADERLVNPVEAEGLAKALPTLMQMDYAEFYDGSDEERALKYRLALSIAYFLEKGAPKVRFEPFKSLKRDYFAELFKSKDMREATKAAFGNSDRLKLFIEEWTRFWQNT